MAAVPQAHVDSALLILALRGRIVLDCTGQHLQTTARGRRRLVVAPGAAAAHPALERSSRPGSTAILGSRAASNPRGFCREALEGGPSIHIRANPARRRSHTLPQQSLDQRARTVSQARRQRMQVLSRERPAARNPPRPARASVCYRGTRRDADAPTSPAAGT